MRLFSIVLSALIVPSFAAAEDFACQVQYGGWHEQKMTEPETALIEFANPENPVLFHLLPDGRLVGEQVYDGELKLKPEIENSSFHFLFHAATQEAPNGQEKIKFLRVELAGDLLNGPDKTRNGMAVGWDGVGTSVLEVTGELFMGQGTLKVLSVTCVRKELLPLFTSKRP